MVTSKYTYGQTNFCVSMERLSLCSFLGSMEVPHMEGSPNSNMAISAGSKVTVMIEPWFIQLSIWIRRQHPK